MKKYNSAKKTREQLLQFSFIFVYLCAFSRKSTSDLSCAGQYHVVLQAKEALRRALIKSFEYRPVLSTHAQRMYYMTTGCKQFLILVFPQKK